MSADYLRSLSWQSRKIDRATEPQNIEQGFGSQERYGLSSTRKPSENNSRTSGSVNVVDNSFSIRRTR